jgi:hypothetical protein
MEKEEVMEEAIEKELPQMDVGTDSKMPFAERHEV